MGPIWGWQDSGGPHVGPMNFAIWVSVIDKAWGNWPRIIMVGTCIDNTSIDAFIIWYIIKMVWSNMLMIATKTHMWFSALISSMHGQLFLGVFLVQANPFHPPFMVSSSQALGINHLYSTMINHTAVVVRWWGAHYLIWKSCLLVLSLFFLMMIMWYYWYWLLIVQMMICQHINA